jgi:hypothetical protein
LFEDFADEKVAVYYIKSKMPSPDSKNNSVMLLLHLLAIQYLIFLYCYRGLSVRLHLKLMWIQQLDNWENRHQGVIN